MRIIGRSRLFRRRSTTRGFAAQDREQLRIGAAMAHVQEWGNLDGFPSSRSERLALMATAMRRGLVAWDRSSDCYALTAGGRRYLDLSDLPPTGGRPRSAGHSARHRWVRRLRAASIAALACLGLAALDSTGTWRITSYFADPTFTGIKGQTATPLAPDQAYMHAMVVEPPPPDQSDDGSQPMSRQTAVAPSAEPATVETSAAAAPPKPSPIAGDGAAHRRHHAKSTRSARSHKGLEPARALGFAEADPYRQYRRGNSFGWSAGFGFFR